MPTCGMVFNCPTGVMPMNVKSCKPPIDIGDGMQQICCEV